MKTSKKTVSTKKKNLKTVKKVENKEEKKTVNKNIPRITIAICVVLVIVFLLGIFLPGNIYLINTAKYIKWDSQNTKYVMEAMGTKDTEERFRTYFQWYNVLHEMGHGLIHNNNGVDIPVAEEEQLVNDFAVAYWRYYGEAEKLDLLYDIVNYAVEHVGDNNRKGVDYMELAKANSSYSNFNSSFFNFEDYGWFQFSSVKKSLESDKTLDQVLTEMGLKNYKLNNPEVLKYETINEETSNKIINDAYKNFLDWGVKFPRPVQVFQNDPNMNSSATIKNIFCIFDLLDTHNE